MNQKDPTFKLACLAIIAGVLAAFGSAVHSAHGLQSEIAVSTLIQR
jgi:hypothetical protein